MCGIAADDKDLILLCGKDSLRPKDVCIQLYDVEGDEWFEPFYFSYEEYSGIHTCTVMCARDSHLYFYLEPSESDRADEDEPMAIYSFSFPTKEISHVGNFPNFAYCWNTDYVSTEEYIYSITTTVSCLNLRSNLLSKDIAAFAEDDYGGSQAVFFNGCIYGVESDWDAEEGILKIFNTRTKETKRTKMPPFSEYLKTIALVNNKIYVVGMEKLKSMLVYSPETDEWESIATKGPLLNLGIVVSCNGRLYCIDRPCYVYEYNFEDKKWTLISNDYTGPICYNFRVFSVKKSW